jgi:aquaporin Z
MFVFVVLAITSKFGNTLTAGIVIGLALALVHLVGIPITGTSVNPARALGPALIVGGLALHQVWLFIVAPLVGGIAAAGLYWLIYSRPAPAAVGASAAPLAHEISTEPDNPVGPGR